MVTLYQYYIIFHSSLFIYLLVNDSIAVGQEGGSAWLYVARDIAFISVALALIFFQFFRNLFVIMRRSL